MDIMKEALKRKMLSLKGPGHGHGESPLVDGHHSEKDEQEIKDALSAEHQIGENDPSKQDLAPEIDVDGEGGAEIGDAPQPGVNGDAISPEIMAALEAIASKGGHTGRGGMSLAERASDGAKCKLAMLAKSKK